MVQSTISLQATLSALLGRDTGASCCSSVEWFKAADDLTRQRQVSHYMYSCLHRIGVCSSLDYKDSGSLTNSALLCWVVAALAELQVFLAQKRIAILKIQIQILIRSMLYRCIAVKDANYSHSWYTFVTLFSNADIIRNYLMPDTDCIWLFSFTWLANYEYTEEINV